MFRHNLFFPREEFLSKYCKAIYLDKNLIGQAYLEILSFKWVARMSEAEN